MFKKLTGLLPAFPTAFDDTGRVLVDSAEALINSYIKEGAD
jgi:dihydrodipicolinate synthase/N-acetylneuraminate lyase